MEAVRSIAVAAAFVALALAGCLAPAASLDDATVAPAGAPILSTETATAWGADALVWEGKRLVGDRMATGPQQPTPGAECTPSSCERVPFRVELPEGYWDENPGFVEVSIEWEHQGHDYDTVSTTTIPMGHYLGLPNAYMHLRVLDAEGRVVGEGVESFHYASMALLESLPPGEYVAEIQALWGSASYRGVVQVEPRPTALAGEQLPDLAILPPAHISLEHPIGRGAPDPLQPLGRKGCDPDEAFEFGAVRCLRFATAFANLGPGRLEMRLSSDEANKATTGEGTWAQRVYDAEGAHRDVPAAPASYHKVHGHYHILGLDVSTVYHYDLENDRRGDPVGAGHKTGFCPVDSALIEPTGLGTTYPVAYAGCCYMWGFCQLDYVSEGGYLIGLTPGWYDVYPWWRADQYVDIAGAPDGVYELETCANPDGHMLEVRRDNNCASALFRLTGDDVETLREIPGHEPGAGAGS